MRGARCPPAGSIRFRRWSASRSCRAVPVQAPGSAEPFKLGTRDRLYEIVNSLVDGDRLTSHARPDHVHDVAGLRTLPPVIWPSKVMNAAVSVSTHGCEGCSDEELAQPIRERQPNLGAPYPFLKPTRGATIGSGEDIVIRYGRNRTDWEVELGTVIGRTGRYISAARAEDYVFGYRLTIDGVTVQEAKAVEMFHSLWEPVGYASSIITRYPGDLLNSGTTEGTAVGARGATDCHAIRGPNAAGGRSSRLRVGSRGIRRDDFSVYRVFRWRLKNGRTLASKRSEIWFT
jgi:2-keto-4-pentenoate hydratase/2-oxohepta-3-ene-1,7-dioic acid hydratase in catechol pathway